MKYGDVAPVHEIWEVLPISCSMGVQNQFKRYGGSAPFHEILFHENKDPAPVHEIWGFGTSS